jgi:rhodanese-related sulfurtransferase
MATPFNTVPYESLSVDGLAQRLIHGDDLQLIDVREPAEIAIAKIDGFTNLPLSEFEAWSDSIHSQFEAEKETVVLCHHGMRSAQMCLWLAQQGFTQLKNVTGGIDAYSVVVDQSVPRY